MIFLFGFVHSIQIRTMVTTTMAGNKLDRHDVAPKKFGHHQPVAKDSGPFRMTENELERHQVGWKNLDAVWPYQNLTE